MKFAMYKAILPFLFLCSSLPAAGAPDTLWTKIFGGTKDDFAHYGQQTSDGGYIACGATLSYSWGYCDIWLLKTDSLGDTLWARTYGGKDIDAGYAVEQTSDNGFIVGALTSSFDHGRDIWLLKIDTHGDTLWTKTYGNEDVECIGSVKQTSDGGYIIAGTLYTTTSGIRHQDVWLIKTDAKGDTLWTKTFGGSKSESTFSVGLSRDKGYIICAHSTSFQEFDGCTYLIRTDSFGDTLWTTLIKGNNTGFEAQETDDGGVIVCGSEYFGEPQNHDLFLAKVNTHGTLLWKKTYGGTWDDRARSVQQVSDGGYILAGDSDSWGLGWDDVWVLRTDPKGDTVWTAMFGSPYRDWAHIIRVTNDNGYIIFGQTAVRGTDNADAWLIRMKPDIVSIISGQTPNAQAYDLKHIISHSTVTISYKIPVSSFVRLSVFNASGKRVGTLLEGHQRSTRGFVHWNTDGVSAGVYIVCLQTGACSIFDKCIITK